MAYGLEQYLTEQEGTLSLEKEQLIMCRPEESPEERQLIVNRSMIDHSCKDATLVSDSVADKSSGILHRKNIESLNFYATELCSISGIVTYKGKPLAHVTVDAGEHGSLTTSKDGVFVFENIEEGSSYSISLNKPSFIFDTPSFSGVLEKDIKIESDSSQLFSIAGTILYKGAPLSGVTIDAGVLGSFTTNEYGSFLITEIHESVEYELVPSKERYVFSTPGSSGSLSSGSVSLLFTAKKLYSISGTVNHNGMPLEEAKVSAEGLGEVLTDNKGQYFFSDVLEDQSYDIKVEKKRFRFSKNS